MERNMVKLFISLAHIIYKTKMKNYLSIIFCLILLNCSAQQEQKDFYENGKLKKVIILNKNGQYDGIEKSYYRNGQLKKIVNWKNGQMTDSIVNYDRNGNIVSKGYIKNDSLKIYRSDNSLEFAVALANGKERGTGIYYDNGNKPIGYSEFELGNKEGISMNLHPETLKLEYIANYKNDKIEGLLIDFYENGVIKSIRENSVNGEGKVIKFYENGVIKSLIKTIDGKASGYKYKYKEDGSLLSKELYYKGEVVSKN